MSKSDKDRMNKTKKVLWIAFVFWLLSDVVIWSDIVFHGFFSFNETFFYLTNAFLLAGVAIILLTGVKTDDIKKLTAEIKRKTK